MTTSISNEPDYPISTVVQMGICRKQDCLLFNTFGPSGALCSGNHEYLTRWNQHFFELIETDNEKMHSNYADHGLTIGVCKNDKCISIGCPYSVCLRCIDDKIYSRFVGLQGQNLVHAYVPVYCNGVNARYLNQIKRVYGPPPTQQLTNYGQVEDDETTIIASLTSSRAAEEDDMENHSIISNISFYTPNVHHN